MPYDPKWHNPTFRGVTLRDFIAWLETKDPQETYDYGNPLKCAVAQYLGSMGVRDVEVQFFQEDTRSGEWLWNIVSAVRGPETFGAALERGRALAARV